MTEGFFDFAQPLTEELFVSEAPFVAFDFETTGLYPDRDSIIEVGAVRFTLKGETERFESFIDPERPIPESSSDIHGITDDMVRGMPTIASILPRFIAFLGDSTLVAHNINFDLAFLDAAMTRCGMKPLKNPIVDTCSLSRKVLKGHPSYALQSLAKDLGFVIGNAHRALDDAELARLLLVRNLEAVQGIESFTVAKLVTYSNSRRNVL
jgi:DNA polymerase-3 subunit epsilon